MSPDPPLQHSVAPDDINSWMSSDGRSVRINNCAIIDATDETPCSTSFSPYPVSNSSPVQHGSGEPVQIDYGLGGEHLLPNFRHEPLTSVSREDVNSVPISNADLVNGLGYCMDQPAVESTSSTSTPQTYPSKSSSIYSIPRTMSLPITEISSFSDKQSTTGAEHPATSFSRELQGLPIPRPPHPRCPQCSKPCQSEHHLLYVRPTRFCMTFILLTRD